MNGFQLWVLRVGLVAGLLLIPNAAWAGRFGGGEGRAGGAIGGARGGGGVRTGGYGGAPMSRQAYRPPASANNRPMSGSVGTVHGPFGGGYNPATRPGQGGAGEQHVFQGPRGGTAAGGSAQRSFTGAGGTTVSGGAGRGIYTGPRGAVAIGGGRGGSISGPGGNSVSGGRAGGVVIGPNGNVHAGGAKGASVVTPGGAAAFGSRGSVTAGPAGVTASGARGGIAAGQGRVVAEGSRSGIASGPGGVVAGESRGGVAAGPGGVVAGGSRSGVAAGPGGVVAGGSRGVAGVGSGGAFASGGRAGFAVDQRGVVAGGSRGTAAFGPYGAVSASTRAAWGLGPAVGTASTRYVSATSLSNQGTFVRGGFGYYNAFTPNWYNRYPGAWVAAGWAAGTAWNALPWNGCASYVGYAASTQPVYYDYGNTITYQGGQVYYDDKPVATEADYAQQATQIAESGQQVQPAADDSWQPLGVFAMTQGDEKTSNDIFQLAINKAGMIRGNYYNAVSDSSQMISGSLDKTSQRLAWTIGDRKEPVYETGLYNLTQDQTTLLVHFTEQRTEQYKLFRIEQPSDQSAPPKQ
jgi:hypothetical protein